MDENVPNMTGGEGVTMNGVVVTGKRVQFEAKLMCFNISFQNIRQWVSLVHYFVILELLLRVPCDLRFMCSKRQN